MSIHIKTKQPRTLVKHIKEAIDDGSVATWAYDDDGDFIHTPPQWRGRCWLRPFYPADGGLVLGTIPPRGEALTTEAYAVYHGRFGEMLLAHFDKEIDDLRLSPMATNYDQIQSD